MSMIPGRIRQQGSQLYYSGQVDYGGVEQGLMVFVVEGTTVQYHFLDQWIFCNCEFFQEKNYCQHTAAVETFIREKKDTEDFNLEVQFQDEEDEQHHWDLDSTLFLDTIMLRLPAFKKLSLHIEGERMERGDTLCFTFKLSYDGGRAYVVRDIPRFLYLLRMQEGYRINKDTDIRLDWSILDSASQAICSFLLSLDLEGASVENPYYYQYGRYMVLPLPDLLQALPLFHQLDHFRITLDGLKFEQLDLRTLSPEKTPYTVVLGEKNGFYELKVKVEDHFAFYSRQLLFFEGEFYLLTYQEADYLSNLTATYRTFRRQGYDLRFRGPQLKRLLYFIKRVAPLVQMNIPRELEIKDFTILVELSLDGYGWIESQVIYDVDGKQIATEEELSEYGTILDYEKEALFRMLLEESGLPTKMVGKRAPFSEREMESFFTRDLQRLEEVAEVVLSAEFAAMDQVAEISWSIEERSGFLEVGFSLDGLEPDEIQTAVQTLASGERYRNRTGQFLRLHEEDHRQLKEILDLSDGQENWGDGNLQLKRSLLGRLYATLDKESASYSKDLERLMGYLLAPESFPLPSHPILEQLHGYQKVGLAWMTMLAHYGFGGILADEMGLGKTIQAISYLVLNVEEGKKSLIVVPSGLLYNWKEELHRFAPELSIGLVYGSKTERLQVLRENHQVYLTSYGSLRQDIVFYQGQEYQNLILDEAQYLKNQGTKVHASLRTIKAETIFALSGTPIENRMEEIGAIFQIVLPGLLPAKKQLLKMEVPDVAKQISPFILRRDKRELANQLPERTEQVYVTELVSEQKALYMGQVQQMQMELAELTEADFRKRKIEFLAGITRLRQICDSPSLFLDDYNGQSGKLQLLDELLARVKENGNRILIFSQFVGMLELVAPLLEQHKLAYYTIQGSTSAKERQEISQFFNEGEADVVLISLKAGGVGLNLTGADTVFLLDLWWNPAVEDQAIGRAHRLGQEQSVQVFRFITKGSIEEKMFELQESKRNLVGTVLEAGRPNASLSLDEMKDILGL